MVMPRNRRLAIRLPPVYRVVLLSASARRRRTAIHFLAWDPCTPHASRNASSMEAEGRCVPRFRRASDTPVRGNRCLPSWLLPPSASSCRSVGAPEGLARTRLAKSVHDAGWSAFVSMLEYKAACYGRTLIRIGRFEPTSQVCSRCGVKDGPKPLYVREWTCGACGTVLDRDINAAVNVAKAAGPAVSACGAQVRRARVPAQRGETGTHPKRPTQFVSEQTGIPGLQAREDVNSTTARWGGWGKTTRPTDGCTTRRSPPPRRAGRPPNWRSPRRRMC